MKDPILITGCARSGTSMTAGIINICGAFGGKLAGPNSNNKRGMFENTEVRNGIVKPFLRSINADPLGQDPLPNQGRVVSFSKDAKFVSKFGDKIRNIIKRDEYTEGQWFYKGAKICLMWQIWNEAFPRAKWIIVRREKKDIVNSCLKTGFMKAFNKSEGWENWVDFHLDRFSEMLLFLDTRCFEIWPQQMIEGDLSSIRYCIQDFLGLQWNEKEVLNFISPALWSNVRRMENGKSNHK